MVSGNPQFRSKKFPVANGLSRISPHISLQTKIPDFQTTRMSFDNELSNGLALAMQPQTGITMVIV